jgi:hypothetical protein
VWADISRHKTKETFMAGLTRPNAPPDKDKWMRPDLDKLLEKAN